MAYKQRWFEKISEEQWKKDTPEFSGETGFICSYEGILLPTRKTMRSAGYDIASVASFSLEPGQSINVPTGWKVSMMRDDYMLILPRSGLGFNFFVRLANTAGVIDSDYYDNKSNEGHCWVKLRNEGDKKVDINIGDGIAQCIFNKFFLVDGDSFLSGETREGGFGHTDNKN